ncbi:ABC transporter substrate-binding protein [Sulfolobus sp. S-194]|uniref:molybdate ABC transporter substrate-binding protein n=1 Tax=Sulfolobus sp. S-194 TaxID=2512240 RepID=UPI00143737B7|nr:substrate-binding domain-containing protein [Sulfolobus sp. S-194]QIW22990.1 ABC transporter substrate-binding protein [Sulfolobus sp. S-194]
MDITLSNFDILEDFWGSTDGIKMSFSGNQWFVVPDLITLLNKKGFTVYIETIPPGIVRKRAGGENLKVGNLEITFKPEIVSLPPSLLEGLKVKKMKEYVENELAIVYSSKVNDWCDLKGKKVAVPNPETEGIGVLFKQLYEEYCGSYEEFISSAYLTKVHHREIPYMLSKGLIEAGVVWKTEAIYWKFNYIIPAFNKKGKLAFALLSNSSEISEILFDYLFSSDVQAIYEKYGFKWITI